MSLRSRFGRAALVAVALGATLAFGAGCDSGTVERVVRRLRAGTCSRPIVGSDVGPLDDPALREISGITASTRNPGVLWVHNDSGDTARIFALGADGATLGTYTVADATAVDWEDIARGPGPEPGTSYLYIGDIGDNAAARSGIVVYRVAEPKVTGRPGAVTLDDVADLHLRYPDGAHDAEALLIDPKSGVLLVITKNLAGGPAGVYRAPADLAAGSTTTLEHIGTLDLPAGLPNAVTAADVSPDGRSVAVRTYGSVLLWERADDAPIVDVLGAEPCRGPIPLEIQGEAIGFEADGRGYVTVSEGADPTLHVYRNR